MKDKKEIVQSFVAFCDITLSEVTSDVLKRLYHKVIDDSSDPEFFDNEINKVKDAIKDGNSDYLLELLEQKEKLAYDVRKDFILEKVDNLFNFITKECYINWADDISRDQFVHGLTDYEKVAVLFNTLDQQVLNGGFQQWYDNKYYYELDDLYDMAEEYHFDLNTNITELLEEVRGTIDSIENLDSYDTFYYDDLETRYNFLSTLDDKYVNLRESLLNDVEDYLIKNIPDDYLKKVEEKDIKVGI